jgi:hypothetical protein
LDGRLLALILPGTGMGEQLSQRLSRIIALGLMPDTSDPQAESLQLRIAYTTRFHYRHDLAQLHQQLRELLEEKKRWGSKPIRVIDHRKSSNSLPREIIDSSDLEDKWNQALAGANEQAMPQNLPLTVEPPRSYHSVPSTVHPR